MCVSACVCMCDVHSSLLMRADKAYGERQGGKPFSSAFYFPFECKRVCARCIFCRVCGQSEINLCLCVSAATETAVVRDEAVCVCVCV